MKYTGIVKKSRNADLQHIESDYKNKKEFETDLRRNGFRVLAILTEKEIQQIKDNENSISSKYLNLDYEYVKQCL